VAFVVKKAFYAAETLAASGLSRSTNATRLSRSRPEPMTRDPFDWMLLAQCQVEGLRLLTIDRGLVGHPLVARG
jgi:PIN domain nuclease of toxin-antitoxin system